MPSPDTDLAEHAIQECVARARTLLALQLPAVNARNYNFDPDFRKMVTELYLVGVMWRHGEQFDLPTQPRDRAFLCLMYMLITDGLSRRAAKRRIQFLNSHSRDDKGDDTLAISVGYEMGDREGALAAILDEYRNMPGAAAAPYRLIELSKPVAAVLAAAGIGIALLIGRSWAEAIGVGFITGVAVLLIASLVFRKMTGQK